MSGLFHRLFPSLSRDIDTYFLDKLAPYKPKQFVTCSKELPSYRYVDLYEAADEFTEQWEGVDHLASQHPNVDLTSLITGDFYNPGQLTIRRSEQKAWPSGPGEEEFLPVDVFWTSKGKNGPKTVIRLSENPYTLKSRVDVACSDAAAGEACLKAIIAASEKNSIYRGAVLRLSFESGTRDEYGDVESTENLRISFLTEKAVTSDDLIIDEETREVLQRNVIDLFSRRDVLRANGVPIKRGVLLYGPPGTGKTFACRYLCEQTPQATRIFVTGSALTQVGAIFSAARMLQPCLLLLEDVDLAFSSREVNLYNSGLADLLDQLDGVRSEDDICVVMTTNSLDRMESAIKDRPGRVSQCIFMDAPTFDLRKQYLQRYLRDFDASALDLDALTEMSDGVSQAFLKEWIYRAVQIATEDGEAGQVRTELKNADFRKALDEMKSFVDGVGAKIVGFTAR